MKNINPELLAKFRTFHNHLKQLLDVAGPMPPDVRNYVAWSQKYIDEFLPAPPPGEIKALGRLSVLAHALNQTLDELAKHHRL